MPNLAGDWHRTRHQHHLSENFVPCTITHSGPACGLLTTPRLRGRICSRCTRRGHLPISRRPLSAYVYSILFKTWLRSLAHPITWYKYVRIHIYVLYTAVADSVSLLFTDPRSVHPLLAPSSLTCTGTDLNPHSAGSLSLSSLRTHRVACACLRLKPVWRDAHPAQVFLFPRSSSVERVVLSARALVHRAGRERERVRRPR